MSVPDDTDGDGHVELGPQENPVIFDEEEELQLILAEFAHQGSESIMIEMYGLLITHHSIRVASSSFDTEHIKETIRQTWEDVTPWLSTTNASILKPQEHVTANTIQFLIEIIPPEVRIPNIDVPVLRRTKWYSDDSMSIETAYMRDSQTGYELLIDAGHAEWCFSSRNIQCNLHVEGRIAFLSLRHPLRRGAVLSFFIHDAWIAHDADDLGLTNEASDETTLLSLIVGRDGKVASGLEDNSVSDTPRPGETFDECRLEENSASGTPDSTHPIQVDKAGLEDNSVSDTPGQLQVIRECKPNHGLIEDFDAVVPFRHRTMHGWPHCFWENDSTSQLGAQSFPALCSSKWSRVPR